MQRPHDLIQTVIFDLDGTLIDTEPVAAIAIHSCFERWNVQLQLEDSTYVTGRTWGTAFDYLFGKYRLPVSRTDAIQEILAAYQQAVQKTLPIVPGSVEAVQNLAKSYPLGLVSGSHRSQILWALDRLGVLSHFRVILGAEDYPRSKPAPDGYLSALNQLNFAPHRCLIFEDSTAGIASARAAGAWVVAITGTNHFQQDTSQAHHQIEDLSSVTADWVRNLVQRLSRNSEPVMPK